MKKRNENLIFDKLLEQTGIELKWYQKECLKSILNNKPMVFSRGTKIHPNINEIYNSLYSKLYNRKWL